MIACLDISSLFEVRSDARDRTDREFLCAAEETGFTQVYGLGRYLNIAAERRDRLKRIFTMPLEVRRALYRHKFAPENANVYRGWFALQEGHLTHKEGIDIGPDILADRQTPGADDPLQELTPLPDETAVPGWRAAVAQHYLEMTYLGQVIMRSLARTLKLPETFFDDTFHHGISTMRLIHYPCRGNLEAPGLIGAPHVDSGLVTLLLQDGVSGLQVRTNDGAFIDVPARDDAVTVNFGRLLQLWTDGRIRATEHQVVGGRQSRYSFPFFYEPRVDALIEPLPGATRQFAPFLYGDFLWMATTRFVEFRGLKTMRAPRGNAEAARAALE